MGKYLITNAIKKSILLKCAQYMEQALIPLFQKESWKIFRLGNENARYSQVTSYDCTLDSEALQQVFSVHHFDLMVYDLRQTLGMQSVRDLEQMLHLAAAYHTGRIILLSGAAVFNKHQTEVEETEQIQADNEEGKYLARLETLALSWKKQGLPITILRFPDIYGLGMGGMMDLRPGIFTHVQKMKACRYTKRMNDGNCCLFVMRHMLSYRRMNEAIQVIICILLLLNP